MPRSASLTLVLALFLTACGAKSESDARPAKATQQASGCLSAGRHTVEGGVLAMPSGARAGRVPLIVVVIPGGGGDRSDRLGVSRAGNRAGFAVLYPTSKGGGFWTLNHAQGDQDVTDVTGLLDRMAATGCFDAKRISITGVSNGAGFAARMGCALPTRFAAVVPVAAGYRALDPCPANARYDFLDIHGTADTVVPYFGKKPGRKGSVPRYTARVARRDGCSTAPRVSTPRRLVAKSVYRGCDAGLRVQALKLTGTDHGWPGTKGGRLPSSNPSGLNATTELIKFVRSSARS
jgi:polyhydroxybutyrate depolymerase